MRDTSTPMTPGGGELRLQMLQCNVAQNAFTMFVLVCGTRIPYSASDATGFLIVL